MRHTARSVICPGGGGGEYPSPGQGGYSTPGWRGYPCLGVLLPERIWDQRLGVPLASERTLDQWLEVLWDGGGVTPPPPSGGQSENITSVILRMRAVIKRLQNLTGI